MIKQEEKTVINKTIESVVKNKREKIIIYTCSDGKQFTNERDYDNRYKKGLELAEEHEKIINEIALGKKELLFHSIDTTEYNGYERKFCFYLKHDLSETAKNVLVGLVYNIKYIDDIHKLPEGWYYVDQFVYEVDSNGRNCAYNCEGFMKQYDELISEKEYELNELRKLKNYLFLGTGLI